MGTINGANIYITGGSSGIGLAFAKLAIQKGAHVAIIARDKAKLEKAKYEIKTCCSNQHQRIEAFSVDVSDAEKVYKAVPAMIENLIFWFALQDWDFQITLRRLVMVILKG